MRATMVAIAMVVAGIAVMLNVLNQAGRMAGGGLFFLGLLILSQALYNILSDKKKKDG